MAEHPKVLYLGTSFLLDDVVDKVTYMFVVEALLLQLIKVDGFEAASVIDLIITQHKLVHGEVYVGVAHLFHLTLIVRFLINLFLVLAFDFGQK